jgi:hypothetical protein
MSSSLGLVGDLDDVELIEDVEEAFGVRFADHELERCHTVGDLFELVETRLPDGSSSGYCATAMCFYRLRRALRPLLAIDLCPTTAIGELKGLSVRNLHRLIENGGLRPPPPYISLWGCLALLLVVALPLAAVGLGGPWWIAAASALPAVALYRIVPIRLPESVETFGDLVRIVSSRSIGGLSQQGARLATSDAWSAFKDILSDHTLLSKEAITPETLILASKRVAS